MPEVNKVVYYGDTLIDLTNDTAEASDVVAGKYFHLANGERASGTANYAPLNHNHDDRYYTETETNTLLNALDNDIFDFKRYRTLSSTDNLNNLDQADSSGVYFVVSSENSPLQTGVLYNFNLGSSNVYQFIIGEMFGEQQFYFRCKDYVGSGSNWKSWHKLPGIPYGSAAVSVVTANNETGFVFDSRLFPD